MVRETVARAEGASFMGGGGSGGMPPRKFESFKTTISSTLKPIAVSKMFQKLIFTFLTLTKRTLSSAVIYFHNY